MKYTSINIQGNLLSEEILQKIETAEAHKQQATDFGFDTGTNLRSEIEYAWSRVKLDWQYLSGKSINLPATDQYGTSLCRKWMQQFFGSLGFELELQKSSLVGENNQPYAISHTASNLDGLPIHIVGFVEPSKPDKNTLDIRSSGETSRLSPHACVQEYLNVTEHLFGIATNGLCLRLIRDSGRLIKLTYIEFDLKRMLDDDKYSEFALLFRLLHASRFPVSRTDAELCILERYYQDSIEAGNRIRDGLSQAVKESLVALGNGLLTQPENDDLRQAIRSQQLTAYEFNHQLLRLIYRLLFLIVTEERDLMYASNGTKPEELDRLKNIYYRYYSLVRLRRLSQNQYAFEPQFTDLWQSLMQTFGFFESTGTGRALGLHALGGELFSATAIEHIKASVINNRVLLQCVRSLNEFEDAKKNRVFINYRSLDVEELGSIYEGLLDLSPVVIDEDNQLRFTYQKGSERSSSGSHYTPEDLVKPLIQHSLEYLIHDRVEPFYRGKISAQAATQSLLALRVADVACGSGHILLSAARRIAHELARVESGEQQPNPHSFRKALKDVIRHCIYGVDKNPLAVELCKVALWLESHNPGEPLNFLDHHIKCGDAIVGLAHRSELENGIADEAFKTLPGDDKEIAQAFAKRNKQERKILGDKLNPQQMVIQHDSLAANLAQEAMTEYRAFNQLPETTPDEIERKAKAYNRFINGKGFTFLKTMADTQVAQFFMPKTVATKDRLMTDAEYRLILSGHQGWTGQKTALATATAVHHSIFHWFIEFPDIFTNGGFDCILGNPPFLGGSKISGAYGNTYMSYLQYYFNGIKGQSDFIAYFVRRIYFLIKIEGIFSLISTNTISQGDTREASLDWILSNGGDINFAIKSIKWPGKAVLEVAQFAINKQYSKQLSKRLNNKNVNNISSYLNSETSIYPFVLEQNKEKCYKGSDILGDAFIIENIEIDPLYNEVIYPFLNGSDLNESPTQTPSRLIINFHDWSIEKAKNYPILFEHLEKYVKPERLLKNDKSAKEKWWQYLRPRQELYSKLKGLKRFIVVAATSKTIGFCFIPNGYVYSKALVLIPTDSASKFCPLMSNFHTEWAWKYGSTMKTDLSYTITDVFETFPFPQNLTVAQEQELVHIGETYHEHRRQLMLRMQLGLTKTYNAFHAREIKTGITTAALQSLSNKEVEKRWGKEVWNLWNHLQKTEGACSIEEAIAGIVKLRQLHVQMDLAVLAAYGWHTDSNEHINEQGVLCGDAAIELCHDFYEVDYLPENDRLRFTISPEARREVLKRLLALNHRIHAAEVEAGLWDKKPATSKRKAKTNTDVQAGLFDEIGE